MKQKLETFRNYVESLMPLEIDYLQSIAQFQDDENISIFSQVVKFRETGKLRLNEIYDKRRYSNLKNWMTAKLEMIDVDRMLEEIMELDKKVLTDQVLPADEKAILKLLKQQNSQPFYFMRIYEMVRNYSSFLLVRLRHQYFEVVNEYLNSNFAKYNRSREVFDKINLATLDITKQYSGQPTDTMKWEKFLRTVSFDHTLDGLNRYLAMVRLTFLYYNYNLPERIELLYDYLEAQFAKGLFYSKRILSNFYSNRLMLRAKLNQPEQAEKDGFFSIRNRGSDYIHYLNNLVTVLLRLKKNEIALELMQSAIPELKKTMSFHNRTGFAALFIKCLNMNRKPHEAESYGSIFFDAYKDKVFEYRWHAFFTAWFQSMTLLENYRKLLTIGRRYKIMEKEKVYSQRPVYTPSIAWYYQLARYKSGEIDLESFKKEMRLSLQYVSNKSLLEDLAKEMKLHVPELQSVLHGL